MSNDDEYEPKDGNTAPRHKPRFVGDRNRLPRGLGEEKSLKNKAPRLDLGSGKTYTEVSVTLYVEKEPSVEQTPKSATEQRADYLKDLPEATIFTDLTGDKDVDQQSMDRGEVPVTPEELDMVKESRQPQPEPSDTFNQSDFAKAFERAAGRSEELRQTQDRDKGPTLE